LIPDDFIKKSDFNTSIRGRQFGNAASSCPVSFVLAEWTLFQLPGNGGQKETYVAPEHGECAIQYGASTSNSHGEKLKAPKANHQ
jgi:hypothetical protein